MTINRLVSFLVLTCLFATVPGASGAPVAPKEPRWKQLSVAYGYVLGQQKTMSHIAEEYSDLSLLVKRVESKFNLSALGEGAKHLEAALKDELGEDWPKAREGIHKELDQMEVLVTTREESELFLAEVEARATGEMDPDVSPVLLSVHPRYKSNPAAELLEGWKRVYSTEGHAKNNGLHLRIELPLSWRLQESNRDNIVQTMISECGHGSVVSTLQIIPLPDDLIVTNDDLVEIFSAEGMREMLPPESTFVRASPIVIEGQPAGMVVFEQEKQRMDFSAKFRATQFALYAQGSLVMLQCSVYAKPDSDDLETAHEKYDLLFKAIANSIAISKAK